MTKLTALGIANSYFYRSVCQGYAIYGPQKSQDGRRRHTDSTKCTACSLRKHFLHTKEKALQVNPKINVNKNIDFKRYYSFKIISTRNLLFTCNVNTYICNICISYVYKPGCGNVYTSMFHIPWNARLSSLRNRPRLQINYRKENISLILIIIIMSCYIWCLWPTFVQSLRTVTNYPTNMKYLISCYINRTKNI